MTTWPDAPERIETLQCLVRLFARAVPKEHAAIAELCHAAADCGGPEAVIELMVALDLTAEFMAEVERIMGPTRVLGWEV